MPSPLDAFFAVKAVTQEHPRRKKIGHPRPEGKNDRHVEEHEPHPVENRARVGEKRDERDHLDGRLDLGEETHLHGSGRPRPGHPFPEPGDDELAAHYDEGGKEEKERRLAEKQEEKRRGHHELVGDRIDDGPETAGRAPAAGERPVEPVGHGREREDRRGQGSRPSRRGKEIHRQEDRHEKDP